MVYHWKGVFIMTYVDVSLTGSNMTKFSTIELDQTHFRQELNSLMKPQCTYQLMVYHWKGVFIMTYVDVSLTGSNSPLDRVELGSVEINFSSKGFNQVYFELKSNSIIERINHILLLLVQVVELVLVLILLRNSTLSITHLIKAVEQLIII